VTPVTGLLFDSEMRLAREKSVPGIEVPILFVEGSDDLVVSNEAICNCAKKAQNSKNKYLVLGGDHSTLFFEKEYSDVLITESIDFLDSLFPIEA